MGKFSYTAVLASGKRVSGRLRSADRRGAVQQLLGRGCHPLAVEPLELTRLDIRRFTQRLSQRVGVGALAVFARQLSSLLKAGMPVTQAIGTLRTQSQNRHLINVIGDIQETLSQHAGTLSDALDEHPRVFNPIFRGLVRAGEESGNLVEVLRSLADHLAKSAKVRGQVLGAFIYPIFILLMGTAAVFVLMSFVIPRFTELFESLGQSLPWPTKVLISASSFLSSWWWAVLIAVISGLVGLVVILRRTSVRRRADRLLLRMPIMGQVFLKLEVARISKTLGALLDNGVRILDALRITGDTAQNLAIRSSFPAIIRDVRAGEALAVAAEKAKVYPQMMLNLIRTGEDTGELPEMLSELAGIYEEEAERAVNGAVKLLEPLLILVVGAVISGIVAAVMLPIFSASAMVE